MSFSSSKAVITDKPLVIKPPYSANARSAGRFAGAAFLLNIGFNFLALSMRNLDLGAIILIAVAERLVILTLSTFAVVHAVRALRELNKPGSKMGGRGEAIAAIILSILPLVATVFLVRDIIRLLA